jgi:hypothetical protein
VARLRGTLLLGALELYYARHGAYPTTLEDLVPGELNQLPPDPFTGEPLRYERHDDSYKLYSLGWDREDDGGVPDGNTVGHDGDIVFSPDN